MRLCIRYILLLCIGLTCTASLWGQQLDTIDFFKKPFVFDRSHTPQVQILGKTDEQSILHFYKDIESREYTPLIEQLTAFKTENNLNDWLYYQLIRQVSEAISPKAENYHRYTLYKWYLMNKSGYDARLAVGDDQVIFYIKNKEDISDIPFFIIDGQQFTCLNYHDYGKLFKRSDVYRPVAITIPGAEGDFSYKIAQMPEFKDESYAVKNVNFQYQDKVYEFDIKVNDHVAGIFKNYPGVDFETYFNIPLTKVTYQSLIPVLKENTKGMTTKDGVDYLMRFTRYAFLYENDDINFGIEKRLSPEQTLMNNYSDCDDRAGLFFFLVKELYNLPMIAILYPTHITMAVQFEQKIGKAIKYEGQYFSICEPTPQGQNLNIGELAEKYKHEKYEIVYHYKP
ncbi:hypothetical protein [Sphingobacterium paucimobilis]|uniref:Transglutaminase-like domain-containing protein n=1 Tax=Sphingobacterium paucimobilis HER1398 TaxID=1346330 RepID=U2HFF7_9SPHI|nr:hypothetical protein [Sphingobacterium paucimobilis]ERJ60496.1 hypothetical protein M472_17235 [Sphingobacterium paucimobilis HER1398]